MATDQLQFDFNPPPQEIPQLWTADDIWRVCDEATIRRFSEDNRVERKVWGITQRALSDYLSMWANTQPHGGIVFIGVHDKGAILGCKDCPTPHLNELETVRRQCPDAKHEFKRISVTNDAGEPDFILVLRVYYNDVKLVETVQQEAFVREGDQKRLLTENEKREIRLMKGEIDVESELVPGVKYPDDFDIELIHTFTREYARKRSLTQKYTTEDLLILAKLGRRRDGVFSPNLACTLLFARDPRASVPGAYIRVLRYDGVAESFGKALNTVFDKVIEGPLAHQILSAEQIIDSQMRSFTRLGHDGRFFTRTEYPKEVWLEAVVNAVVHRSYNLKHMNIFVKLFEDRMVVESPGLFMPPTTGETVYEAHNPRNPNLMWALYYFDFVKCAFEGTRRMRAVMQEAKLPEPKFAQKREGVFQVEVTLRNDVEHRKAFVHAEVADVIDEETYVQLLDTEKMVINTLADTGTINITSASLLLASDWRTAKTTLDALVEKGIIERKPGKDRDRFRPYYLKGRPR